MEDDFFDISDIMDRMFGNRKYRRTIGNTYERLIDKEHIYYTFELRSLEKEDISVKPTSKEILIIVNKIGMEDTSTLTLPYEILPKETKVTFINGILDIITNIDPTKDTRILIED